MGYNSAIKRQIRNLLVLLGTAVLSACLLALYFISSFGTNGKYVVKNSLIDPQVISKLAVDYSISLNNYDKQQVKELSLKKYEEIFDKIANDESLLDPISPFQEKASLIIIIDSDKTFQIVDFAENHYRIKLRQGSNTPIWVYFYHPNILKEVNE